MQIDQSTNYSCSFPLLMICLFTPQAGGIFNILILIQFFPLTYGRFVEFQDVFFFNNLKKFAELVNWQYCFSYKVFLIDVKQDHHKVQLHKLYREVWSLKEIRRIPRNWRIFESNWLDIESQIVNLTLNVESIWLKYSPITRN